MKVGRYKIHLRFFIILGVFSITTALVFVYVFSQKEQRSQKKVLGASVSPTAIKQKKNLERRKTLPVNAYSPSTIPYKTIKGDTLFSIAKKYHADPQTIIDYPYNNLDDNLTVTEGQVMIIPSGYLSELEAPEKPQLPRSTGILEWPVEGVVTQYSSWFHPGAIDISASIGTEVKAAASGKVVKVEQISTGYGTLVTIEHEGKLTTSYGHLSKSQVVWGQNISKGDLVGLSGASGRVAGPMLYFETKKNGEYVDPLSLLVKK